MGSVIGQLFQLRAQRLDGRLHSSRQPLPSQRPAYTLRLTERQTATLYLWRRWEDSGRVDRESLGLPPVHEHLGPRILPTR